MSLPLPSISSLPSETAWFDEDQGFLYIDFRGLLGVCLRLGTWGQGLSAARWDVHAQAWEDEQWDLGLPINLEVGEGNSPIERYALGIPPEVRDVLKPFRWRQLVLLRMIRHHPEVLELCRSNPLLAFMLADTIVEKGIPIRESGTWAFKKRKEMVSFVGGLPSEAMVKVLGKIRFNAYTEAACREAKKLVKDQAILRLAKTVRSIPGEVLTVRNARLDFVFWLANNNHEVLDPGQINDVARLWNDSKSVGIALGIENPTQSVGRCKSIHALKKLHDRWSERLNSRVSQQQIQKFIETYGTNAFPEPPIPGTDEIVPITAYDELLAEGKAMHNCVVSYAERIMEGKCYIYQVLKPERATLEIRGEGGKYLPAQLRTISNGQPSNETKDAVEKWIEKMGLQILRA